MNQADLQSLSSRPERPAKSVLSVYLGTDQSRQANLNRGFEALARDMMTSLHKTIHDASELQRFRNAARHIEEFVSTYQIGARGIVMFYDETDGFFWHEESQAPIENQARWDRELFLQPLAAALDESEAYAVALAGKATLRLFLIALGEIDELVQETFPSRQVRHIRTAGMDHIGSASQIQRKADERLHWNLRHMAEDVDWLMQSKQVGRLVLAGAPELTAELRKRLPKRSALRFIGSVDIATDAPDERVLDATQPVVEQYERDSELQFVDELVTRSAKNEKVVTGLGHTLKAVNQARVWQLVYAEGFRSPGFECAKCTALFSLERESCAYCGGDLQPVADVVEHAIEHALRKGAGIEVVKGEASESLIDAGGIGAFLKARTGSIEV